MVLDNIGFWRAIAFGYGAGLVAVLIGGGLSWWVPIAAIVTSVAVTAFWPD